MSRIWRIGSKHHDLSKRGMIMGVLNVTPDSFSDGGKYFDLQSAAAHALEMVAEGADILDIGGESTRPGADPVSAAEEIRRIVPAIEKLRAQTHALISVDTMKAEVARAAVAAGADIINDVTGFSDPDMVRAAAETGAGLILMHMQGTPRTMQANPVYTDVVREVREFFASRLANLAEAGVSPASVALDPGFGFGKTQEHNLALLRALPELRVSDCVLAVGVSRKSMIARLLQDNDPNARYWPTVALTAWMRDAGADVIRVHDVKPNAQAMRMIEAIHSP
ncbi:dihydropteroate synthase [Roseimicrobium sp. ORNL1]|uniref:dihydropteroate synthase n=1 Tax=Roseimicrobium sp. ORNL1 TaxID=2711231 RepID=UPI0013E0F3C4|nr:dihydropteroate synthase [Roseimicrobium sp. ORNL1]QIF01615.1 dihydropteroate synthase [Roseimicrobium sp. ORNL1]